MARFGMPVFSLIALLVVAACGAPSASIDPPAPSVAAIVAPAFELHLAATDAAQTIPDTGPFGAVTGATENACSQTDDGFWTLRYSGGEPYVRVGLLVGPEAVDGGASEDVSAEIVIGSPLSTLLNFDQPGYRSGDAPGRSDATVTTTTTADAITFDIVATTPRAAVDFTDYPYTVDVDLTVTCPLGDG